MPVRAVEIQRFGDPSGMRVVEASSPTPALKEVVIQTEAIGVGGVDAMIRRGTLADLGLSGGFIPGSEVAGTVAAVGADVDEAWIGRRVWAFTGLGGAYAERAVAQLGDVVALPDGLTSIDAVTLGSAGPVAHFALAHAHLDAGESVLIRGAAGSIGIAAVELAARAGARGVAVTTSSTQRGNRLRQLGATDVLDRDGTGGTAPTSFDVIIDIVGGPDLPSFIERLAPNGRLVVVGMVAGPPPADFGMHLMDPRAFQQSRSFGTFSLSTVAKDAVTLVRADLFDAAAGAQIHAVVHDVLPLEQAAEAHREMDAGRVFGRIVLTP